MMVFPEESQFELQESSDTAAPRVPHAQLLPYLHVCQSISASLDLETILSTAVRELARLFAVDRALITQRPQRGNPHIVRAEQVRAGYPSVLHRPVTEAELNVEAIGLNSLETAIAINATAALPQTEWTERTQMQAQLLAPIVVNRQCWGLIILHQCAQPRQWHSEEMAFLCCLSVTIATAIDHAQQMPKPRPHPSTGNRLDYAAILRLLPDVMFLLNRDGVYIQPVQTNPLVREAWTLDEILGQPLATFLPPEVAERYLLACHQVLASEHPVQYEQEIAIGDQLRYQEVRMMPYCPDTVLVVVRDITERKETEQDLQTMQRTLEARIQERTAALRATDENLLQEMIERAHIQSELNRTHAEFAAIFRAIPDAIVFIDPQQRIRRINPAFSQLFGYTLSEIEGQLPRLLYADPDAYEQQLHQRNRLTAEERIKPYEVDYLHKDGYSFPTETVGTAVRDTSGNLLGFVEVIRDIRDRKQAEAALRESETRYRDLYENTPVMLHSIDPQGRLVSVSNYWLEQLGYSREAVIGRPVTDFLTAESRYRAIYETLPSFQALGYCKDVPYEWVCKDGTIIEVLLSAITERDEAGQEVRSLAVLIDVTERNRVQAALRESEMRFRTMADTAPVLIWMADAEQQYTYFNRGWLAFTGRTLKAEQGEGWQVGLHPDDRDRYQEVCTAAYRNRASFCLEFRLQQANGKYRWLLSNGTPRFLPNGHLAGYIGSCIDITTQKQLEQDLEEALSLEKELAEITLQSIGDGVITTNADAEILYLNPVAEELTGWALSQARGKNLAEVFCVIDEITFEPIANPIEQVLTTGRRSQVTQNLALIHRNGAQYSIEDSAAPIRDRQGAVLGVVLVFRDVTRARALAKQLSWQANHDALTGLMNRRFFEQKLTAALASATQEGEHHTLCYLDLDQFKVVNDTCGHIAGDELLRQITAVIKAQIRAGDALARLGGDEFGVVLYHCSLPSAVSLAEDIRQAVEEFRFTWQGKTFGVGVSIGLVSINENSPNLVSVLSAADTACYAAKDKGRNRIQIYQPDDSELETRRQERRWSVRIRQALESDRFQLLRQPIRLAHAPEQTPIPQYEVLLRMVDETGEIIPPSAFIPAAERYDLMPSLDRWVVRHCFARLAQRPRSDTTRYAINLSGTSWNNEQFLAFLKMQLETSTIAPGSICFEITETATIADLEQASQFMHELKSFGCQFALDDFGSGMSSFGYLKTLPVDYIKIDGRFIRDVIDDPMTYAIVESINHVGHVMNLKTIAECVEDQPTIQQLQEIGVDYLQGYGVGRPELWLEV